MKFKFDLKMKGDKTRIWGLNTENDINFVNFQQMILSYDLIETWMIIYMKGKEIVKLKKIKNSKSRKSKLLLIYLIEFTTI